jgi:AcrR family transcriptional regulator
MKKINSQTPNYRADVQSEIKTLTRQRILAACQDLFLSLWVDQITLQDVANRANVTVQTILRHFGSRDILVNMAIAELDLGNDQRNVPVQQGNLQTITAALIDFYEIYGLNILRTIAQEDRYPQLNLLLTRNRRLHREWVQRSFDVYLRALSPLNRQQLEDQLYSLTEVYFWRIYRIDLGKSREILENTWQRMLRSLLQSYR